MSSGPARVPVSSIPRICRLRENRVGRMAPRGFFHITVHLAMNLVIKNPGYEELCLAATLVNLLCKVQFAAEIAPMSCMPHKG